MKDTYTFEEMIPDHPYVVVKGSENGTFEVGDKVYIDSTSELLMNVEAQGWIDKENVEQATKGMLVRSQFTREEIMDHYNVNSKETNLKLDKVLEKLDKQSMEEGEEILYPKCPECGARPDIDIPVYERTHFYLKGHTVCLNPIELIPAEHEFCHVYCTACGWLSKAYGSPHEFFLEMERMCDNGKKS